MEDFFQHRTYSGASCNNQDLVSKGFPGCSYECLTTKICFNYFCTKDQLNS